APCVATVAGRVECGECCPFLLTATGGLSQSCWRRPPFLCQIWSPSSCFASWATHKIFLLWSSPGARAKSGSKRWGAVHWDEEFTTFFGYSHLCWVSSCFSPPTPH